MRWAANGRTIETWGGRVCYVAELPLRGHRKHAGDPVG
jgi:hypothetical protein